MDIDETVRRRGGAGRNGSARPLARGPGLAYNRSAMRLSDFDYPLPERLISQKPLARRDSSRMMVVDRGAGTIHHDEFRNFPEFMSVGDVMVINRSRVIPARAWGRRGESRIEFLFLKEFEPGDWEVMCRPARRLKAGDRVDFTDGLSAVVAGIGEEGRRRLRFDKDTDVRAALDEIGYAPLPPYIKRRKEHRPMRDFDLDRYQTVFAREGRSIAAPTAGLHFTPEMMERVRTREVEIAPVSLDVGLATFQPVRVEDVENHRMLEETFAIPEDSAETINRARREGRPVTAVGTTSVRTLESAANEDGVAAGERSTRLFIRPGFEFRVVDRLLTNFHLPESTLLMLTTAFGGYDLIMRAYHEAVSSEYRFFSYGDCMLIL